MLVEEKMIIKEPGKIRYAIVRLICGQRVEKLIKDYYSSLRKRKRYSLYDSIHYTIDECLRDCKTNEERICILTYMIDTIVNDVCGSIQADGITSYSFPTKCPFPLAYHNDNSEISFVSGSIDVELKETQLYVRPWKHIKIKDMLMKLTREDFINDDNHSAVYFDDIDLCYVTNGNHSISAGKYLNKGVIKAKLVHMKEVYEKYDTNGDYWKELLTGYEIPVEDYRLAAIFSIAKMRNEIRNNFEEKSQ